MTIENGRERDRGRGRETEIGSGRDRDRRRNKGKGNLYPHPLSLLLYSIATRAPALFLFQRLSVGSKPCSADCVCGDDMDVIIK